jgi:hypothetical protein
MLGVMPILLIEGQGRKITNISTPFDSPASGGHMTQRKYLETSSSVAFMYAENAVAIRHTQYALL